MAAQPKTRQCFCARHPRRFYRTFRSLASLYATEIALIILRRDTHSPARIYSQTRVRRTNTFSRVAVLMTERMSASTSTRSGAVVAQAARSSQSRLTGK